MVFKYHTVERKILRELINSTKIFSAILEAGLEAKRLLECHKLSIQKSGSPWIDFLRPVLATCVTNLRPLNFLQSRSDYTNQWAGAYYGGHFYDGYAYAFPAPHNPNMYAPAAYGAYPMYGTHQQQVS